MLLSVLASYKKKRSKLDQVEACFVLSQYRWIRVFLGQMD